MAYHRDYSTGFLQMLTPMHLRCLLLDRVGIGRILSRNVNIDDHNISDHVVSDDDAEMKGLVDFDTDSDFRQHDENLQPLVHFHA